MKQTSLPVHWNTPNYLVQWNTAHQPLFETLEPPIQLKY